MRTASDLGFRPWGNVGVGDSRTLAETTLRAMAEADYRLPEDAPFESSYSGLMGPSSREQELTAALSFLEQKSRR